MLLFEKLALLWSGGENEAADEMKRIRDEEKRRNGSPEMEFQNINSIELGLFPKMASQIPKTWTVDVVFFHSSFHSPHYPFNLLLFVIPISFYFKFCLFLRDEVAKD